MSDGSRKSVLWAERAIAARRLWVLDTPDPKRLADRCFAIAAEYRDREPSPSLTPSEPDPT